MYKLKKKRMSTFSFRHYRRLIFKLLFASTWWWPIGQIPSLRVRQSRYINWYHYCRISGLMFGCRFLIVQGNLLAFSFKSFFQWTDAGTCVCFHSLSMQIFFAITYLRVWYVKLYNCWNNGALHKFECLIVSLSSVFFFIRETFLFDMWIIWKRRLFFRYRGYALFFRWKKIDQY